MPKKAEVKGLEYAPGVVGKHAFRVRERHIAEHTASLIASHAVGAAKLDLVLRGVALLPQHAGRRRVGLVRPAVSYEQLHDLCRNPSRFATTIPEDECYDPAIADKKRTWVREQLERLEKLGLVVREERPGRRPLIVVLRDDGSGRDLDDPDGGRGSSYLTLSGAVLASDWFKLWGAPELAAYLAALVADRFARFRYPGDPVGGATWFQPLRWFSDSDGDRPAGHVAIPFSERTLERGFQALREANLVTTTRTIKNPRGGRFVHPRTVYVNRFHELDANAVVLDETALSIDT